MTLRAFHAEARRFIDRAKLQAFMAIYRSSPASALRPKLADLVYYETGSKLLALGEWNALTVLQLQYELQARGHLRTNEVLTEWQLRLRLRGVVMMEQQEAERCEEKLRKMKRDDLPDDFDHEEERKYIFTKNKGRTMLF